MFRIIIWIAIALIVFRIGIFILLWCIGQLVLWGLWFPKTWEAQKKIRIEKLHAEMDRLDKYNDANNNFFHRRAVSGKHNS